VADPELHGVLVVDKPEGPTSHDIVDRVRRALGVRRVGHTGTLDPFATGVLPVCVGRATRLARFLAEGEKVYEAAIRLGLATTTDDRTGGPKGEPRPVTATRAEVEAACRLFVGRILQVPPAFSAKHVDGRRLYELAREGDLAPRPAVPVAVAAIEVGSFDGRDLALTIRCSPGTYIRALARDLGEALGCGGHLVALRRTASGGFDLRSAVSGDALRPEARAALRPMGECLHELPAVRVGEEGVRALRHGRDLSRALVERGFPDEPPPGRLRVLDEKGDLLALAVPRGFGLPDLGLRVEPSLHPDVVLIGV
jgi:tRNA pseudouridine55 synthase